MKILVTNDDGIDAPGLLVAKAIARELAGNEGQVTTIAPATEQSGVGHSISYIRPTLIEKRGKDEYLLEGSPADCVLAGLYYVLKNKKPDLILSGVNKGQNVAEDVLYSGTVGAAMEGAFQGVKSISLSQSYTKESLNSENMFETSMKKGAEICKVLLSDANWQSKTAKNFYNVNFPACRTSDVLGVNVCPTGTRQKSTFKIKSIQANWGRNFLWVQHQPKGVLASQYSDSSMLDQNFITISPLKTEITNHEKINQLKELFTKYEA